MNFIKQLPSTVFGTFEVLATDERRRPWIAVIIISAVVAPAVVVAIHRWWRGQ
jgi:hypothetical protein